MATKSINDWEIEVQFSTKKAEKQIRDFEKRLKKIQDLMNFPTSPTRPTGPRQPRSPRPQQGFQLADDRQLKLLNTIDSVVRRAKAGLGETSDKFQEINTRAEKLRGTVSKIGSRVELERLNDSIRRLREDTTTATAATRRQNAELQRQRFIARATSDSIRNLARSYVSVFAAIEGGRSVFRTANNFENLSATMLLSSGSAEQASADFEFLRKLSVRLGLDLVQTGQSFAKFGVAASSAGLSSAETNSIFTDLAETIRATGLTQDRANLSMLAFQQILAGPVAQLQEFNQLNESMPQFSGAAKKALQEMGFEVENYRKAVESGTVDSVEFVRIVTRIMSEQAKETGALEKSLNSITAQSARLATAWQTNVIGMFEAGTRENLSEFIKQLTFLVESLGPAMRILGKASGALLTFLSGIVRVIGSVINSITHLTSFFNNLIGDIGGVNDELDKTAEKFSVIGTIFDAMKNTAKGIVGLVLMIVGAVERSFKGLANIDFSSFSGFRQSFKEQQGLLGESFSRDFSNMQQRLSEARAARNGTQNVNSGNTVTANISVANGDPDTITRVVKDVLQGEYKVAY